MPQPKKTQQSPRAKGSNAQPTENLTAIQSIHLPKKEQPRRYFAPEKMEQLIVSIEAHGILEPLIVRPLSNGDYELVAGERRFRAAKELGLTEVPIVIRDFTDEQAFEVALLENLQRDDLNPIDETEGLLYLLCQSLTCSKEEVVSLLNRAANAKRRNADLTDEENSRIELIDQLFRKVGRLNRESFRTNRLPLLNMPEDVLQVLRQGELEYTKAKAIANLDDPNSRSILMKKAISASLPLSEIKTRIRGIQAERRSISHQIPRQLKVENNEQYKTTNASSLPTLIKLSTGEGETSNTFSASVSGETPREILSSLYKLESDAWDDEKKQKELVRLLSELQRLLQD
jgi:ParB family transcriptional regulator, chromosome partitioning protein